jgi:ATP synthase protein I
LEERSLKDSGSLRKIAPFLNLGGIIAGCMVAGVLLGYWLDKKFQTEPWLLLAGSVLGIVSSFYHFFKVVLHIKDESSTDDEEK